MSRQMRRDCPPCRALTSINSDQHSLTFRLGAPSLSHSSRIYSQTWPINRARSLARSHPLVSRLLSPHRRSRWATPLTARGPTVVVRPSSSCTSVPPAVPPFPRRHIDFLSPFPTLLSAPYSQSAPPYLPRPLLLQAGARSLPSALYMHHPSELMTSLKGWLQSKVCILSNILSAFVLLPQPAAAASPKGSDLIYNILKWMGNYQAVLVQIQIRKTAARNRYVRIDAIGTSFNGGSWRSRRWRRHSPSLFF